MRYGARQRCTAAAAVYRSSCCCCAAVTAAVVLRLLLRLLLLLLLQLLRGRDKNRAGDSRLGDGSGPFFYKTKKNKRR